MGVLEVLAAMALTIGCVGIVMLAALAANRLYEHQERRDEERRARRNSQQPWDGDHTP